MGEYMDKYCIIEKKMYENHAGAKARERILPLFCFKKNGFLLLYITANKKEHWIS